MQRRTYSNEQKAAGIARVFAGESPGAVAADLDIEPATLRSWVSRESVALVATTDPAGAPGLRAERLRDDLSDLMHAEMTALQRHAGYYASDEWLTKQPPEKILESTRTLRRAVHATMDRLAGRTADAADASAEADA